MNWPPDIKNWILASIVAFAISYVVSLIAHVPYERAIVASALAATLVFTGLFFRSKGRREK
ncbi:MAG: hypothetical protein WBQ25_12210 [Nitrososphaeraceae archaeon]